MIGGIGFNPDKLVHVLLARPARSITASGSIGLLGLGINNRDTYIPPGRLHLKIFLDRNPRRTCRSQKKKKSSPIVTHVSTLVSTAKAVAAVSCLHDNTTRCTMLYSVQEVFYSYLSHRRCDVRSQKGNSYVTPLGCACSRTLFAGWN